jgi:hypothetical protein
MLRRVVSYKLPDVSEVLTAFLMMEAVITSETSDNFYDATRRKKTVVFILAAVRT